ncbi:MAG TPA: methyl-accepting chemotaxis protein [Burkholderiaceae bacterium]|nr:methyl-accepting chemotaxis protein [Burkholderiaceae bacterium]
MAIGRRILVGFGSATALLLVVAGTGIYSLRAQNSEIRTLVDERVPILERTAAWQYSLLQSARHSRNALILEKEDIQAEVDALRKERDLRGEIIKAIEGLVRDAQARAPIDTLKTARASYSDSEERFARMIEAGDLTHARRLLLDETRPLQLEYLKGITAFEESQKALVHEQGERAERAFGLGLTLALSMSALAVVAAVLIGLVLRRSITRQLGGEPEYAAHIAREIAAGNLAVEVHTRANDRSSLLLSMRSMRDSLVKVVDEVRTGVNSVSTASAQIAAGNRDLSSRTEAQASSLQQTAASIEQLTSTVKQSADNARQANQLAALASASAEKGGAVVEQVVSTMDDISAASKKIGEIIAVIDGLAFQTNILALNAAVEAARAGEQGRGFAVVAAEVRSLAQRSAQAAREIKSVISRSVDRVDAGSMLVNEAGASMSEIVAQVKRVTDLIGEITSASQEQSAGIGQVNDAVAQMDRTTRQNAALVEQSAAAAQSLRDQAQGLAAAVSVFKFDVRGSERIVRH